MDYMSMARVNVDVDAAKTSGAFEWWRHSLGHGAVNGEPLPRRVAEGIAGLKPRLVRIFLQEYFDVYPEHGRFDWSRLDPYMDAMASTGANVLATINLKPRVLFPRIDHSVWRPNDAEEYQNVIYELVKRYSVERPIVTHWEHVNEPDIGEQGGCPFLIPTAEENHELYSMMVKPILAACPKAKVGGPSMAYYRSPILKGFVELCHRNGTPLDFVSWHSYNDNTAFFAEQVEYVKQILSVYPPGKRPEMMLNEMNKCFDFQDMSRPSYRLVSVEDQALLPKRASFVASAILSLMETGLDWSHYFLMWDCCMHPSDFKLFFSDEGAREVMYKHWNETPHRFGLFSEGGAVRPQYFVYRMLSRMGEEKIPTTCADRELHAQAARGEGRLSVVLSNYSIQSSRHLIVTVRFFGLKPGLKRLTIHRIDNERRWDPEKLELIPVDQRRVDTMEEFEYQCFVPADSVSLLTLEEYG